MQQSVDLYVNSRAHKQLSVQPSDSLLDLVEYSQRLILSLTGCLETDITFVQADWVETGTPVIRQQLAPTDGVGSRVVSLQFSIGPNLISALASLNNKAIPLQLALETILLGELAYTLDRIVITHTYGSYQNKPTGVSTVYDILGRLNSHDSVTALGPNDRHRWKQLTTYWVSKTGKPFRDLVTITASLRELRKDAAHQRVRAPHVSAQELAMRVPACCQYMGPGWHEPDIRRVIDDMKRLFTSQEHVLVSAQDLYQTLRAVQVPDDLA